MRRNFLVGIAPGAGCWTPSLVPLAPRRELNGRYSTVDRNVAEGRAGQLIIIHARPVSWTRPVIPYAELRDQAARFAEALAAYIL